MGQRNLMIKDEEEKVPETEGRKKKRETKNACKLVFWKNDSQKMLVN